MRIRPIGDGDVDLVVELSLRAWAPVFASLERVLGSEIFGRLQPDWREDQRRALAFLVPPLLVGVLGMNVAEAGRYEGPPDTKIRAGELLTPPEHDPDKPTAVVLLSNRGAEVTDVLAPYEVLSESGPFNVYAAAPERKTVPLSGASTSCPNSRSANWTKGSAGRTRT